MALKTISQALNQYNESYASSRVLLQKLINTRNVRKTLNDNYYDNRKEVFQKLVNIKNFKNSYTEKYDIRKYVFTKEEYIKYLKNKLGE